MRGTASYMYIIYMYIYYNDAKEAVHRPVGCVCVCLYIYIYIYIYTGMYTYAGLYMPKCIYLCVQGRYDGGMSPGAE